MTSERAGFVHVWLPDRPGSVVCGRLDEQPDGALHWVYARSYLARSDAVALDPVELPLISGVHRPPLGDLHGVVRDAAPDAWGRRVQLHSSPRPLRELDFLMGAGIDRIGALAVTPAAEPPAADPPQATLAELMGAAELIEAGTALGVELSMAMVRGTSVGGARPKALVRDGDEKYVAKFSSNTDTNPVVRTEHAAMRLGLHCGLAVASTQRVESLGRDVLLVRRFDREHASNGEVRKMLVSALTILRLHEMEAPLASYLDLAAFIRRSGAAPLADGRELFRRMVFNILVGNTDDHARNHAFFWDGRHYTLTPAYDICPDLRAGRTAYQAMAVGRDGRRATLKNAISEAGQFSLSLAEARAEVDELVERSRAFWPVAADEAQLTALQREQLERETVLGPGCFE